VNIIIRVVISWESAFLFDLARGETTEMTSTNSENDEWTTNSMKNLNNCMAELLVARQARYFNDIRCHAIGLLAYTSHSPIIYSSLLGTFFIQSTRLYILFLSKFPKFDSE